MIPAYCYCRSGVHAAKLAAAFAAWTPLLQFAVLP